MRLIALALVAASARMLGAQTGTIALVVTDSASRAAIPGAAVSIDGRRDEVTDANGHFFIILPAPSKVSILVRRIGFNPRGVAVDLVAGDTVRVAIALTASAQKLADVSVTDTLASMSPVLAGFERRKAARAGSASYVGRNDIEKLRPLRTSDLLRRISSIQMIDSSGVLTPVSRRNQKAVILMGHNDLAPCPLQIALDGVLRQWGFDVNSIPPEQIHGIEVFPGPSTIPAEFATMRRDAECGLVMIWTRRDK
jgi:hypothetical protein